MHVEFIRDYPSDTNPIYHKGERLHEDSVILKKIVFDKFAVEIEPARRGTKEWFAQRMEQSAIPRQVHANDTSVAAPTLVPGWGIVKRGAPERYFIQQTTAVEVLLYEGVPAGCPASVAAQLVELNGLSVQSPEAVEARRIAECERKNAAAENKEREQSALARIFSGK